MGDSHESLQAEVQEPRALIPSTAALRMRPHSQRPQLRGGGALRPQSRGPGAPRLPQLGCRPLSGPAALSSHWSSVGLWFAISFLRQLEPQQPPARLLKMPQGVAESSRSFQDQSHCASPSGPPRFSPCPPSPPSLCGDLLPSTPYFRSCRDVTSSQRPPGWFFNCNRTPLLPPSPSPHLCCLRVHTALTLNFTSSRVHYLSSVCLH